MKRLHLALAILVLTDYENALAGLAIRIKCGFQRSSWSRRAQLPESGYRNEA